MNRKTSRSAGAVLAATAAAACYFVLIRKWQLGVGATDEEIARPMPLDERVEQPTSVTNRAITIPGPPEEIWPWIAQMGELPRGGFYSYVTVERVLGMKVANSDRILPGLRDPKVGEAIDRTGRMVIQAVEPNRHLVLGPTARPDLKVTWALALHPAGERSTRLVSRCRAWMRPVWARILSRIVLEAGQLLMERKMLSRFAGASRLVPARLRTISL